jgi:GH24 family phage-related lysozyme (muramidase)
MQINDAGLKLIERWEGLRLKAYQDVIGVWTIGYGHTSAAGQPYVRPGMVITQLEAEQILARDLDDTEKDVASLLKRTPTPNQFAAMVSLAFNIGGGNFRKSTVLAMFNRGNLSVAADAFRKWNKSGGKVWPGLTRRREDERKLFLS